MIYTDQQTFEKGTIIIEGDRIARVILRPQKNFDDHSEEIIDAEGLLAIPGLIDSHFHGCMGEDFCDGNEEAISKIAEYEASVGVTCIAPATMTLPVEELEKVLVTAANYKKKSDAEADLVGINMEGPFISPAKKGAQDERNILPCSVEVAERFLDVSGGLVKFIGLAPEEGEDPEGFIAALKDRVDISLAHTNASYEQAMAAFHAGANHAVHLYNAMPVFSHRAPGVVGAIADSPHVYAEMICDGVHLHPATVRMTFKMLGTDRIILISDSMRACGMPDGQYLLGGLEVNVKGKYATLVSDGTLAGSCTNLMDCLRTVVQEMKISLADAVACATINPAKSLHIDKDYGSITEGKKADIVLLHDDLRLESVIKDGVNLNGSELI